MAFFSWFKSVISPFILYLCKVKKYLHFTLVKMSLIMLYRILLLTVCPATAVPTPLVYVRIRRRPYLHPSHSRLRNARAYHSKYFIEMPHRLRLHGQLAPGGVRQYRSKEMVYNPCNSLTEALILINLHNKIIQKCLHLPVYSPSRG